MSKSEKVTISDGGRFVVERCWGAQKNSDGARMRDEAFDFIAALEAENAELKHELAVTKAEKQDLFMRLNTNLELEPILSDYGIKVGRKLNKKLNISVFILTDIYGNELPPAPAGKEGEA